MYYNRIDLSEEIDVVKSNSSKEYIICRYWFLIMGSSFKILYVMVSMIWRFCVLI